MDGWLRGDEVVVDDSGRQQFYDTRGYGRPVGNEEGDVIEEGDTTREAPTFEPGLALAPVEAAHLLYRGDLDAVRVEDRRLGFRAFLAAFVGAARFLVYKDLRDRGFYLSAGGDELTVYPRGSGPWDGEVRYRVWPVGERDPVPAGDLDGVVLGVADGEGELTYLDTGELDPSGGTGFEAPTVEGELVDDRVFVWEPPPPLYERGFYGQPLDDGLQLSLVEAAHLAAGGALAIEGGVPDLLERGRAVEGERFDRRLRAYRELRDRGLVPKTGFKFGADFRVYETVDSVEELGHARSLVRVLPPGYTFRPRELSLYVRLAHGVRKRMVFARTADEPDWIAVGRLTP